MFEFADQDLTNWLHHHFLHFSRPVTRQTMELLCLCRRRPFILPNLRRLRLTCGDIQLLRFIPMMLGPNLQALSIAFYAGNILLDPTISNELYHSVLRKLLESLPSLCPSLTELAICTEQLPDVANAALSFAYKSKHLLGCFIAYIPTWPREVLLHLSQQEHLRDIYLSLDEDTANLTWLQSVRYPFPSLDTLDMRCPSLKSCATLIKLMGACTLRLLKFEAAEGPPPTTDLQELFVALRTHCSVSTLQSLLVEYYADRSKDGGRTETSQEEHSFTGELVSPMYAFSQLRFFRLHTPFVSFLNDQDLRDMADHWPLLIELRLADDWEWFAGPFDTTWAGLAYVAWKCPQLIEVAIAMDMRADNVTETTSQEGFRPNRHLRHINCLDSVMCDVEMCARSVHAFAPLVWEIWGHGWGEWDEDHASKRPPDQDPIGFYETATSMIQETHASEEFAVAAKRECMSVRCSRADRIRIATDDPLEDMNPWSALATTRPKPTRTWIQ